MKLRDYVAEKTHKKFVQGMARQKRKQTIKENKAKKEEEKKFKTTYLTK